MRRLVATLFLALVGAALLASVLLTPVAGVRTPYSAYNPGAQGLSSFAADLHGRSVFAPALRLDEGRGRIDVESFALRSPEEGGALVVVEPSREATEEEQAWLSRFVSGGGTLVVAARGPAANSFLAPLTATRLMPGTVLDFAYSRAAAFPYAEPRSADPLLANVSLLVLNHPAALSPGPRAQAVATTSPHAFHDLDGDGLPSAREPRGAFLWLSRETLGRGELIVLADPDLLSNGMADVADAGAFSRNLAARLAAAGRVFLDEGHRPEEAVSLLHVRLEAVPAWLRYGVPLAAYAAAVGLLLARGGRARPPLLRSLLARLLEEPARAPPTRDDVRAEMLRRHPRWDPQRVAKALAALEERP